MSWREEATFIEIINDYIRYVLDQQVYLYLYSASSQTQPSTGRYFAQSKPYSYAFKLRVERKGN
jgi:hypothetical protein